MKSAPKVVVSPELAKIRTAFVTRHDRPRIVQEVAKRILAAANEGVLNLALGWIVSQHKVVTEAGLWEWVNSKLVSNSGLVKADTPQDFEGRIKELEDFKSVYEFGDKSARSADWFLAGVVMILKGEASHRQTLREKVESARSAAHAAAANKAAAPVVLTRDDASKILPAVGLKLIAPTAEGSPIRWDSKLGALVLRAKLTHTPPYKWQLSRHSVAEGLVLIVSEASKEDLKKVAPQLKDLLDLSVHDVEVVEHRNRAVVAKIVYADSPTIRYEV